MKGLLKVADEPPNSEPREAPEEGEIKGTFFERWTRLCLWLIGLVIVVFLAILFPVMLQPFPPDPDWPVKERIWHGVSHWLFFGALWCFGWLLKILILGKDDP